MKPTQPTVADIAAYDEIIDVRSPAEFAEDHIPGAINCPVLDDAQRAEVGTLYKQVSPFEAKKIGAALVSENIARHLKTHFLDRPSNLETADLLLARRRPQRVNDDHLPGHRLACRPTGGWLQGLAPSCHRNAGKPCPPVPHSRSSAAPQAAPRRAFCRPSAIYGEQVLDLESLASHKGSVLGILPGAAATDARRHSKLACCSPCRASTRTGRFYVEAESRKIGNLHVPEALIARIRQGKCFTVEATTAARVAFLLEDYDYFLTLPDFVIHTPRCPAHLQSRETLNRWQQLSSPDEWADPGGELLELALRPALPTLAGSQLRPADRAAQRPATDDLSPPASTRLAAAIVMPRTAQIA